MLTKLQIEILAILREFLLKNKALDQYISASMSDGVAQNFATFDQKRHTRLLTSTILFSEADRKYPIDSRWSVLHNAWSELTSGDFPVLFPIDYENRQLIISELKKGSKTLRLLKALHDLPSDYQ